MKYQLLKNSTRGRKGEVVELQGDIVRQLQANGIIGEPLKTRTAQEPEVKKVVEPTETKRKKRASKSAK